MTDISQLPGAFLFDLDGVLTPTLDVHKRAAVLPPSASLAPWAPTTSWLTAVLAGHAKAGHQ